MAKAKPPPPNYEQSEEIAARAARPPSPPPTYFDATSSGLCCKDFYPVFFFDLSDFLTNYGQFHDRNKTLSDCNRLLNEWLSQNKNFWVINCEFVDFKFHGFDSHRDRECTVWRYNLEKTTPFFRSLRVWYVRREVTEGSTCQTIKHLSFTPNMITSNDDNCYMSGYPCESLPDYMDRINCCLRSDPIAGEIISIQMFPVKRKSNGKIDAEKMFWHSYNCLTFCNKIIIFYNEDSSTKPKPIQIGLASFLPKYKISQSGKVERQDNFKGLLAEASKWVSKECRVEFVNAQFLWTKMVGDPDNGHLMIDHETMQYKLTTFGHYASVLRVWYTTPFEMTIFPSRSLDLELFYPKPPLTFKTFEPLSKVVEKLDKWVKKTRLKVFCVQTVSCPCAMVACESDIEEPNLDVCVKYTGGSSGQRSYWVTLFAVILIK